MANKLIVDGDLIEGDAVTQKVRGLGFAFGFGVFETIKFLGGNPCFFAEHLNRLEKAAQSVGLQLVFDEERLLGMARDLFAAEGVAEGVFKIVICEDDGVSRLTMFVRNRGLVPQGAPIRVCVSRVVKSSAALTSRFKTTNYMEASLQLSAAKAAGFDESLFCNENSELTEGTTSNLFFVKDKVLKTPQVECGLLDGIVRAKVLEIARDSGIRSEEGRYKLDDLWDADEVFLTSSGFGPRVVKELVGPARTKDSYGDALFSELNAAFRKAEVEDAEGLG